MDAGERGRGGYVSVRVCLFTNYLRDDDHHDDDDDDGGLTRRACLATTAANDLA